MKVLIISKPRMGSTVLAYNLSKLYRLDYHNEPSRNVFGKEDTLIKIVVGEYNWKLSKRLIFNTNYDKVILMRRNEEDSKISMAHLRGQGSKGNWHRGYESTPNLKIGKEIHELYKHGEKIYQEILGMNTNLIELTYENLYNEDIEIRRKELDKVIGEDKVHWLLHKNMLDKLNPKFKYTNLPRTYNHKEIL